MSAGGFESSRYCDKISIGEKKKTSVYVLVFPDTIVNWRFESVRANVPGLLLLIPFVNALAAVARVSISFGRSSGSSARKPMPMPYHKPTRQRPCKQKATYKIAIHSFHPRTRQRKEKTGKQEVNALYTPITMCLPKSSHVISDNQTEHVNHNLL